MIKVTDKEFWIHPKTKEFMDDYIYNLAENDWDFVYVVTGGGKTRVGKSLLATQLAYYCASELGTKFDLNNVVFSGDDLIKKSNKAPKNSVFVYDEARAELEGKRSMQKINQTLYDFFSECGMLNHIIFLVMPDFFELQKGIAVSRSVVLFDVFYSKKLVKDKLGRDRLKFDRGYYNYYNEKQKRKLYYKGKVNFNDYSVGTPEFVGEFRVAKDGRGWVIDKDEYEKRKLEFLRRVRHPEEKKVDKWKDRCIALIDYLKEKYKLSDKEISEGINKKTVFPLGEKGVNKAKNRYNRQNPLGIGLGTATRDDYTIKPTNSEQFRGEVA